MTHHPAIKSVTSTDHKTTRILPQDAEDFADAMGTLGPAVEAYVRGCMDQDSSKEGIRKVGQTLQAAEQLARGWFIGRFGTNT